MVAKQNFGVISNHLLTIYKVSREELDGRTLYLVTLVLSLLRLYAND